jgi:hypothetical protein
MDNAGLCKVCGGYRGCRGKSGYPLGYVGELGRCGHEESRGPRGKIKTPEEKQRSKEIKKKQREMMHQSIAFPLATERTDYKYCKLCGGPLRDPSIPCIFCESKTHLITFNRTLQEIITVVKLMCIDKCSREVMLIINTQLDDLENTFRDRLSKYDFMSTLTDEEKYKLTVVAFNILAVVASTDFVSR